MKPELCNRLDEYLLELLDEGERVRFESHLGDCPVCRREAELQRRADELLAQVPAAIAAPEGLMARLEHLTQATPTQPTNEWRQQWLTLAGALVLLIALFFWLQSKQRDLPPENRSRPSQSVVKQPENNRSDQDRQRTDEQNPHHEVVQVNFSNKHLAQPIESKQPGVTIYWVYPKASSPPHQLNNQSQEQ